MKIFDFLIYYLGRWYEEHPEKLSWSKPVERAIYVVGLITICWLFSIGEIIAIFIIKSDAILSSEIPFVILGLLSMMLYNYIYIRRGRYERLKNFTGKPFKMNDKTGEIVSIIFTLLSVVISFAIFMIFG